MARPWRVKGLFVSFMRVASLYVCRIVYVCCICLCLLHLFMFATSVCVYQKECLGGLAYVAPMLRPKWVFPPLPLKNQQQEIDNCKKRRRRILAWQLGPSIKKCLGLECIRIKKEQLGCQVQAKRVRTRLGTPISPQCGPAAVGSY